jgi:hypothetical protein
VFQFVATLPLEIASFDGHLGSRELKFRNGY